MEFLRPLVCSWAFLCSLTGSHSAINNSVMAYYDSALLFPSVACLRCCAPTQSFLSGISALTRNGYLSGSQLRGHSETRARS